MAALQKSQHLAFPSAPPPLMVNINDRSTQTRHPTACRRREDALLPPVLPVHLSQIVHDRYQIATKHRKDASTELQMLKRINSGNSGYIGRRYVRKLVDSFSLPGQEGEHTCLVFEPLREPLWLFCRRFVDGVTTPEILKPMLCMVLEEFEYLHTKCHIIHTDLKPDNIMIKLENASILEQDARSEFENPLPQKQLPDRTVYLSRNNYGRLRSPTGVVQIVDFDLAVSGEAEHFGAIFAEIYRAPEVVLDAKYSYSADVWSLGVMLWELLEGNKLFRVHPREEDEYDGKTHLTSITALLGDVPKSLSCGRRYAMFYSPDGNLKAPVAIPKDFTFGNSSMSGEEKALFVSFVKRMITWDPRGRNTARELLDDPWLHTDFPEDG